MPYRLTYSETSRNLIRKLDPDQKSIIRACIKSLSEKPYSGKRLERELSGYFSVRINRYRVIYQVIEKHHLIEIHYVGHRKDIYQLIREKNKTARS
jgi:mRNA-degrading endonuclease RelE of RelBE toxin-antitoxin system